MEKQLANDLETVWLYAELAVEEGQCRGLPESAETSRDCAFYTCSRKSLHSVFTLSRDMCIVFLGFGDFQTLLT